MSKSTSEWLEDFCIYHKGFVLTVAIVGITTVTWYLFYGTITQKGKKFVYIILLILVLFTANAGIIAYRLNIFSYYILWTVLPFVIVTVITSLQLRLKTQNTYLRPVLMLILLGCGLLYEMNILNWLTPVFALVNWGR
ncbi:hypothetical protein L4X63_09705 [Geomonas sp. Red32]|uniref:hypothetical protein n=1 Tax=Geomonas sp. Red32 TaxID=2912856 RepID=UPI00202D0BFB|nr:hypothetical protein [Geomonas sp. Red32]MCM0081864.1 hypothetical protein [Geomonas sp. Red32]